MNKEKLYRILKILCMILCTVFLLTACFDREGGKIAGGEGYVAGTEGMLAKRPLRSFL